MYATLGWLMIYFELLYTKNDLTVVGNYGILWYNTSYNVSEVIFNFKIYVMCVLCIITTYYFYLSFTNNKLCVYIPTE